MKVGAPSFSSGTVSAVVLFTYLLCLFLVFWNDVLPDVPTDQQGLSLQDAYLDLHYVSARPHPYNSHANDYVRNYILAKVRAMADEYPHVRLIDDLRSNGSWASAAYGVYFEGTNILVKIEGTNTKYSDQGGVLFSAHYDSVSTAPGTTDDGMGVVTLLQLIEYYAKNRVERTAIFNINNGEEDWLNGAHAFLQHPWSRIPDTFLNLEGAASGGRPILFRATSSAVLHAFKTRNVPHPHANVLSADAFKRGVIRSGTDYSVYTDGAQMQGLDLAFYKGRSKYHTKFDAVPYTDGHEKSLWSMMEAAQGAGTALLNDSRTHDPDRYVPAVYFDLFAARLVLFSLDTLYIFNILFLILGPILLVGLFFIQAVIKASIRRHEENHYHQNRPSVFTRIFTDFRLMWRWAKFWVAILVTVGVQALLIFIFIKANPYVIYSSPYIVLFCLTTISFLTLTWTITSDLPPSQHDDPTESLPEAQRETVLLQCYTLSWILLLLSTIAIGKAQIGGLYLVTFWSIGLWLACSLGSLETLFEVKNIPRGFSRLNSRSRRRARYSHEATERSPLNRHHDNDNEHGVRGSYTETENNVRGRSKDREGRGEGGIDWWLLQFILVVPAPLILTAHIGNLLLDATCQTLADGNSKVGVYACASLIGFLFILPLAPFSFRIHRSFGWMLLFFFVIFGLWALFWTFPFDPETPLKVYFQQSVQVDGAVTNVVTSLYGVPEYLKTDIVSKLPSAQGAQVDCLKSHVKEGLTGCSWKVGWDMMPSPGNVADESDAEYTLAPTNPTTTTQPMFFIASISRTSPTSAQFTLKPHNTRNCRLYFTNRPILRYTIHNSVPMMQHHYPVSPEGIKELRLWSREWDKTFVVDVEWRDWLGLGEGLKGRVACEWAEYASASAGVPGEDMSDSDSEGARMGGGGWRSAKIPSVEEVLSFLPTWVAVSKFTDGLVEVWEEFDV
ncbi:hypothetical protein AN958_11676 [Leucoagaricus sp. SymC.cos]|nr:hypothetical protein AN958_11676 [Leucoagaricus sp. SymC.cos]